MSLAGWQHGSGVPAAAGYPQYSGNLIYPMVSRRMIERFHCTSTFANVSTTDYENEFSGGGDQVTFWKAPKIIVRKYVKNGTMKTDHVEIEPCTITIDCATYFNFKIDCIDERMIQNWANIKKESLDAGSEAMSEYIDKEMFGSYWAYAHPKNQGAEAGCICGSVNLGEFGAPVVLTADNILFFFTMMSQVLDEQCIPAEGRYVVLPICFKQLIFNGPLACADCSGHSLSLYESGRLPTSLVGFEIFFSHHVKMVDDSSNRKAWHVPFGLRRATVFASTLSKMREIEDKDSFDTYHQALHVYGWDVILPEALGHAYVTMQ